MGAAKQRGKLSQQILSQFPNCIYCGGVIPATTVDHVPPLSVFAGRKRPRGLEFPSCRACNNGARKEDCFIAYFSRVYPDVSTESEKAELRRLARGVDHNFPGLFRELIPS